MFKRGCVRRERIYSDEGFFVAVGKDKLIYSEGERRMSITVEMGSRGFAIYKDTIGRWDDKPSVLVGESERRRIENNVRRALESQGQLVVMLN
jgi:hypothetical protein